MTTTEIDQEIRNRIDVFLGEISELVREAALEAVREALGSEKGVTVRPGRRPKASASSTGSIAKARTAARRKGKRLRRTMADLEKMSERIYAHVKANPGCRMEDISKALGEDTYDLRRPLDMLKEKRKFKVTGNKRATQYFVRGAATGRKPAKRR